MNKLLVIADDFTGANDTGVQLAKKGARVEVVFSSDGTVRDNTDVLVINTESRAKTALQAMQDVEKAISLNPAQYVYKKIDSTFRGNVGAEIEAALKASGAGIAFVAAAIPAAGRVTRNGCCYVNGMPLLETEFATDPKTPIYSSSIKDILASQTKLPIHEINLDAVRQGHLQDRIRDVGEKSSAIIVLDAETDADLFRIGEVLMSLTQRYVLVGAAGLANALPQSFYQQPKRQLPVLVVAGSMSEATRRQILFAAQENTLDIIDIEIENLLNDRYEQELVRVQQKAVAILQNQRHCVLRTCRDSSDRDNIPQLCLDFNLTRQGLGERISQSLGNITRLILQNARVGGLFLTGGDIAIAVAQKLAAQGYRISAEVSPCIPCGTFINSEIDDLPVITKAGGFGNESTLRDSLFFIEEMYSDK